MTEQKLQELNKKLAERAGFKIGEQGELNYYPDGSRPTQLLLRPFFTKSLGLCFKWLMSIARKEFGVTKIDFCYFKNNIKCRLFGGFMAHEILSESNLVETEPLALCLAIEKLIDLRVKTKLEVL